MKAERDEDGMLLEYDFSSAVRGAFANRWTPEEREQILRDSIIESARTWHRFARERVQALEAALFTRSMVTTPVLCVRDSASATTLPFHALVRLVGEIDRTQLPRMLYRRLADLADECGWAAQQAEDGIEGTPAERLAYVERLERIGREAEALKGEVDGLVQQHLARSGMSAQEIERTTEETAKLWLAA
ncbi:hypothetical protein [Longimicrobium sp.]|uniref:hypothetical protein n=1 Tax=Longimicrobium sp. TaxID=2029185 RepID=UPI003B3BDB0E